MEAALALLSQVIQAFIAIGVCTIALKYLLSKDK